MSSSTSSSDSSSLPEIIIVYAHNFTSSIKQISSLLETYNYIGMDTEFPGIVHALPKYTQDFYYQSIKLNVNSLNLIQLGLTLTDINGNHPKGTHTWQFNLKFNLRKDKITPDSYTLLMNSGIDFETFAKKGIDYTTFAEYLTVSGLVLNPNVHWITFHGAFDFAYLLRMLLGYPLPENENDFLNEMNIYFPNHYDIRVLSQGNSKLIGGLNRLSHLFQIKRIGEVHQAGSDAQVTIDLFHNLKYRNYIDNDIIEGSKNVIYGLGLGADDDETISYTKFESDVFVGNYTNAYNTKMIISSAYNNGEDCKRNNKQFF